MFHNIMVMSRENAIQYSNENIPPTIIVSIRDLNAVPPAFASNSNILDILYVEFADEEDDTFGMDIDQAGKILDFVAEWLEEDVDIVVHCSAGISRSAGTAAALMLLVNGDDSPIFDSPMYAPNMNCYRKILIAAGLSMSDDELDAKYEHQFALWRRMAEENGII